MANKVRLVPELLDAPLKWQTPQLIFVNSMSDLFHEDVPLEFILRSLTRCTKQRNISSKCLQSGPNVCLSLAVKYNGPRMCGWSQR